MTRCAILCTVLFMPAVAPAAEPDATTVAQDILTKGAALFDTRDAGAMAATYTEEAELILISKDKNTDRFKAENTHGRAAIEQFYRDLFKDRTADTTARNVVQYARFVGPDTLVIHGDFTPDVAKGDSFPFVQTRVKEGDRWFIIMIQVYIRG